MEKETGVTFADVAGVDEAKAELQEVVAFLRNPREATDVSVGACPKACSWSVRRAPQALLARAVAGEAGRAVLLDFWFGVRRVVRRGRCRPRARPVRASAQAAPAIIFIDELDALGRARGAYVEAGTTRGADLEPAPVELDGFDPPSGLVLLAATNRPESSIRRCCAPVGSTARSWSTGRTRKAASRSWRCT